MPTVLVEGRFVVKIWGPPREHAPPHVHVHVGREGLVVVRLGVGGRPPVVWRSFSVRPRDVLRAYRIIEAHEPDLRVAWEAIHGQA